MPCAPGRAAGGRQVLQHAGVLQHEGHVGTGLGEVGRVLHLRREDLQVEDSAVVGEMRDIALDRRVGAEIGARGETVERVLVPVQLHAHAAQQRDSASRSSCGRTSSTVKSA